MYRPISSDSRLTRYALDRHFACQSSGPIDFMERCTAYLESLQASQASKPFKKRKFTVYSAGNENVRPSKQSVISLCLRRSRDQVARRKNFDRMSCQSHGSDDSDAIPYYRPACRVLITMAEHLVPTIHIETYLHISFNDEYSWW